MSTDPKPLGVTATELDVYADLFGVDREMLDLIRKCGECDEPILVCDNGVWLDVKPIEPLRDEPQWFVMKLGSMSLAASGGGDTADGSRHTLHEHYPPETS